MEFKEIERHEHDYKLTNEIDTSYSKTTEIVTKRELVIRGFLFFFGLALIAANSLIPELIWIIGLIGIVMVVMSLSDVLDRLRIQEATGGSYKNIEESASFYEIRNAIAQIDHIYVGRTSDAKLSTELTEAIRDEFLIINPWNNYLIKKHPKKASYMATKGVGVTLIVNQDIYWKITPEFISPQEYKLIVTKHSNK